MKHKIDYLKLTFDMRKNIGTILLMKTNRKFVKCFLVEFYKTCP